MTSTQYVLGWATYLVGATGCLLALWMITGKLGPRFRRVIRLTAAFLLYTPWWTSPGLDLFSPAFLVMLYDGLSHGPEAMVRTAVVVGISVLLGIVLGLSLPVKQEPKKKKRKNSVIPENKQKRKKVRKEPSLG